MTFKITTVAKRGSSYSVDNVVSKYNESQPKYNESQSDMICNPVRPNHDQQVSLTKIDQDCEFLMVRSKITNEFFGRKFLRLFVFGFH